MRDANAVDSVHMASGARGNKHVTCCQLLRFNFQGQHMLLCLEHNAVLGFLIDFDLRMVGAHVTLSTSARTACNRDGTGVAGVGGGGGGPRDHRRWGPRSVGPL